MQGLAQLASKLKRLAEAAPGIAARSVSSGVTVMEEAVQAECPGHIAREVGSSVSQGEKPEIIVGKVGLGVGRGSSAPQPHHGRFLTKGTKHIQARHFVQRALEGSVGRAFQAMKTTATEELNKLVK